MPLSASQWVTCLPVTAAALVLLLAYIATTNGNGDGERRARICPLMEAPAAEALIRSRAASRLIAGGTRALTDPLRAADDDGPRHESRRARRRLDEQDRFVIMPWRLNEPDLAFTSPEDFFSDVLVPRVASSRALIVDVGANTGQFSVSIARSGHDGIAFEPVPSTCALLRSNLERERLERYGTLGSETDDGGAVLVPSTVSVHCAAVGSTRGHVLIRAVERNASDKEPRRTSAGFGLADAAGFSSSTTILRGGGLKGGGGGGGGRRGARGGVGGGGGGGAGAAPLARHGEGLQRVRMETIDGVLEDSGILPPRELGRLRNATSPLVTVASHAAPTTTGGGAPDVGVPRRRRTESSAELSAPRQPLLLLKSDTRTYYSLPDHTIIPYRGPPNASPHPSHLFPLTTSALMPLVGVLVHASRPSLVCLFMRPCRPPAPFDLFSEGFELSMLRGARRMLRSRVAKLLLLELSHLLLTSAGGSPRELLEAVASAGYDCTMLAFWGPYVSQSTGHIQHKMMPIPLEYRCRPSGVLSFEELSGLIAPRPVAFDANAGNGTSTLRSGWTDLLCWPRAA